MVNVQEQAFSPVKKSEAQDVVVEERRERAQNDVRDAETAVFLREGHLCTQRRIAVHVPKVVGQRGIGGVQQRVLELRGARGDPSFQIDSIVRVRACDYSQATAEEAQLGVGIKAAVTN